MMTENTNAAQTMTLIIFEFGCAKSGNKARAYIKPLLMAILLKNI